MRRYLRLLLPPTLLLSAFTLTHAASSTVTTIDVPFAGAISTSATGINDSGQIAGFYLTPAGLASHGFLLKGGNFSSFDFTTASCCTDFWDINNSGHVVGYGGSVGFLFVGGHFSIISVPGSSFTSAQGINNAGDIVGYSDRGAFLLKRGSFSFISAPGAGSTKALGINDAGQIVGTADLHGYLLSNGVFSTIDFPGALNTAPNKINNKGEIVGSYEGPPTTPPGSGPASIHGFVLNQQGFSTFDILGSSFTQVFGINNAGDIVGSYRDSTGNHGFVAKLAAAVFAGTPGKPNCHGKSVSALAQQFGGLNAAASALGFPSVPALQDAIHQFCER